MSESLFEVPFVAALTALAPSDVVMVMLIRQGDSARLILRRVTADEEQDITAIDEIGGVSLISGAQHFGIITPTKINLFTWPACRPLAAIPMGRVTAAEFDDAGDLWLLRKGSLYHAQASDLGEPRLIERSVAAFTPLGGGMLCWRVFGVTDRQN